jgi:ribosome-associated translation inhibitor RaiA
MQDNFSIRNWKNTILHEDAFNEGTGEINVYGYQTQHFDMCPGAVTLFKNIKSGEYTDGVPSAKEEASVIAMAKLHDALFNMEKKALGYGEVDKSYLDQAQRLENEIYMQARNLDLEDEVKAYIPGHIDKIANVVVNPRDLAEEDDIELEIPGETPTVDKTVQAKASKQDKVIKAFQDAQAKMKSALEKYKSSEGDAKDAAKEELKTLTPEFQAAKQAYEKLKGVKL